MLNKLKNAGIPKSEIDNITDSGDEREQQIISQAIDKTGPVPSEDALSSLYPANFTGSASASGVLTAMLTISVTAASP